MNYKISNGRLLIDDGDKISVRSEDLYIRDGKISFIPFSQGETFETVDAKSRLVMTGLINMHTHAYMTIMRNYADDVFIEMIRTGTTCFVDMHMYHRQSPLAAKQAGMRGFIGRGLVGDDLFEKGNNRFREALEEKAEFECGTLKFVLSPHAIYTCSTTLLRQVAEQSRELSMLKQIHLSESVTELKDCLEKHGMTPVRLLADLGFLDDKTILAHCVQMQGGDLDLIRESGSTIVTNPASNAKLGNGFAPVADILRKNINLCIGTDGTASNNTLNMFRELGLLSLIHKGIEHDPAALPAETAVRAATVNAAKALHMEERLGVIREGACADLIFLDLREPSLFPGNNILSSLCYSANGC